MGLKMREVPLQRHDLNLLACFPDGSRVTRYDDGTDFGRVLVNRPDKEPYWMIMEHAKAGGVAVTIQNLDGEVPAVVVVR